MIIADISSFSSNGHLIGHWPQVAQLYMKALQDSYDVKVAGSELYNSYFSNQDLIVLPYSNQGLVELGMKEKIKKIRREIKNCLMVLNGDDPDILFQSSGFTSIIITLTLFGRKIKNKNIFLIEYGYYINNKIDRFFFRHAKKHINGILVSKDDVGRKYNCPYCVIPDYLYFEDPASKGAIKNIQYDFAVVGTMNSSKDLASVVRAFRNTSYRVIIAGFFRDRESLRTLKCQATKNITIKDQYLDDAEYSSIIEKSRFCLLPYKETYNNISSGVVYDYLFRKKPVIAKRLSSFQFIEDNRLGILYDTSPAEAIESIRSLNYDLCVKHIEMFLETQKKITETMKKFVGEKRRQF